MRESRTYGSVRGACDETHVPTATGTYCCICSRRLLALRRCARTSAMMESLGV